MNDLAEATYQRKVKTVDELVEILGPRPRSRNVIMCHGTFDLVHPGHVRHLIYAKNKADVLVASLTSDQHISKADYRPFVPQELRAMNLAALEVVDFVLVDDNATPIENISRLQPDYFAKGYEYSEEGVPPRTRAEMDTLAAYGGEMIFTPGDIVFSSSAFIESARPDLAVDKLAALMRSEGVTFDDLRNAVGQFAGKTVHVLGDTIVDSYVYCAPIGTSTTKTPTLSVRLENEVDFVGGAGIVSRHMSEAGADVRFTTVVGDDDLGKFVQQEMARHGIQCHAVVDPTRVTTRKAAYIANGYRLLKVDRVDNRPISDRIVREFEESLSDRDVDAHVFSDFRHGIFARETTPRLIAALPDGPLRVGDSQVASRWGNILDFQGFDLITPNEREARFALGDQDSVVRPLAMELYKKANCGTLMLKLGSRGLITYRAPSPDVRAFFTVDAFVDRLVDAMGAGDALLAYATLGLAVSGSSVVASILGSLGAALACEQDGNTPVDPNQVLERLDRLERLAHYT